MDTSDKVSDELYREHYCAFVDVLGFENLITELSKGDRQFQSLRRVLRRVHNPEKGTARSSDTQFRAQSISDAVAISALVNPIGIMELMNATESLTLELLHLGYFARGVIVKGMLYHDEHMVFGEALVRAYQLEREVVRFPRIMLTMAVADDINRYCDGHQLGIEVRKRLRREDDGPWHIHVLRSLELLHEQSGKAPTPPHRDSTYFTECKMHISRRLNQAVDNPRHFEKVKWFTNYWNDVDFTLTGGMNKINWPGEDEIPF
jgi:hypothetical protein